MFYGVTILVVSVFHISAGDGNTLLNTSDQTGSVQATVLLSENEALVALCV